MDARQAAEETLAGRVNDWAADAQTHARVVLDLHGAAESAVAAHAAEAEGLRLRVASAEARLEDARRVAQDAERARAAVEAEALDLAEKLTGLRYASRNLLARVVARPDNEFVFAYDSRGVIDALRAEAGRD